MGTAIKVSLYNGGSEDILKRVPGQTITVTGDASSGFEMDIQITENHR